jgi:hypothetical protein
MNGRIVPLVRRVARFMIRDIVWLTLVVALAVGWWVHQRRLTSEIESLRILHMMYDRALSNIGYNIEKDGSLTVNGRRYRLHEESR